MVNAYDTAKDGTLKTAAWVQQIVDALGAINTVGFYPQTLANYTIFQVGSDCYARNNATGSVDSGPETDVDVVAQYCHDQLTTGGLIDVTKGQFTAADEVHISNQGIYFRGAGTGYDTYGTEWKTSATNKACFRFSDTAHRFFGGISDMAIDGEDGAGTIGIHIEKFYSDLWFQRLWIKGCASAGVKMEGNVGGVGSVSKLWNLWFLDNLIENCLTGPAYYFTNADATTESIDRVTIRGGHCYNNINAIKSDAEFVFHVNIVNVSMEQEKQHAINFTGMRHCNIFGNHIFDCGTAAANTYNGIYIGGTGGSPPIGIQIFGNSIDNTWTVNQKYAIELAGDCDHICIFGNMLDGGGVTGDILNGTTGTDILIMPNTGYASLHNIEHHTAADTLTIAESQKVHTNLGSGGNIKLTLPQDAVAGTWFDFAVMESGNELQVDAGAAGAIYANDAKSADDAYIWADAEGESIRLIADGNGDWVTLHRYGTWTVV